MSDSIWYYARHKAPDIQIHTVHTYHFRLRFNGRIVRNTFTEIMSIALLTLCNIWLEIALTIFCELYSEQSAVFLSFIPHPYPRKCVGPMLLEHSFIHTLFIQNIYYFRRCWWKQCETFQNFDHIFVDRFSPHFYIGFVFTVLQVQYHCTLCSEDIVNSVYMKNTVRFFLSQKMGPVLWIFSDIIQSDLDKPMN